MMDAHITQSLPVVPDHSNQHMVAVSSNDISRSNSIVMGVTPLPPANQGLPMLLNHGNHGNHVNQYVLTASSTAIAVPNPTGIKNPKDLIPSQQSHLMHNPLIQLPVSLDTNNHIQDNMPPLDAMRMEGVSMPTGPGLSIESGRNGSNVDSKTHLKHTQSGVAKDIPVEDLEFDGSTVLCRVCGDKASGFHYGVHACEGCKGFFRRSIQQKIQYRPCLKNQMCNIMRVNRNRCQYCRLRKCISVGMSRDAVRFGRVPKREKAKIMEQMQKVNAQLQGNLLSDALGDPSDVTDRIITAHAQYCDFTHSKFAGLFEKAWEKPKFVDCPAHMACPLSPAPDQSEGVQKWDEFSNCFTPAIRNVVNFAKSIPGFSVFSQEDQVTLLKAGTFEVLLVHLACLFDIQTNTMMFTNGKLFRKIPQQGNTSAGFLLDSMFDFADRLNLLRLTDHEMALFSSLVVTAPDRPGLRYHDQVQKVHAVISHSLQKMMKINHPDEPAAFSKLLMKLPDLRTLNTLHSEKLLGLTVPQNGRSPPSAKEERVPPSAVSDSQDIMVQPKCEPCPVRSKSPSYPEMMQRPAHYGMAPYQLPMMRCPMSGTDRLPAAAVPPQFMAGPRAPMRPIVPHQVTVDPKDKELILQTPFGSFHRQVPLPYAQFEPAMAAMMNMGAELNARKPENLVHHASSVAKTTNIPEQNLKSPPAADGSISTNQRPSLCSSPDDYIDVDIQHTKSANPRTDLRHMLGKESLMNKLDVRRMMSDPLLPEVYKKRLLDSIDPTIPEGCRKRLLESIECEVDPKIAKLWEYDMRSSRSNSLSSSSSMESTDSAYRTISNPGTPRSHYEMVRSPYANPTDVSARINPHTVTTTQSTLPRVVEENSEKQGRDAESEAPDGTLPTLRKMLLAAPSEDREEHESSGAQQKKSSDSTEDIHDAHGSSDQHYFLHKKLKMKQSLSERNQDNGEFRMRAASFSTVVSKMRPHMAPPFLKPRSVEAPPRLTTKSPPKIIPSLLGTTGAQLAPLGEKCVPYGPAESDLKLVEVDAVTPKRDTMKSSTKLGELPATATLAAIVSHVMEAALSQEDDEMSLECVDEERDRETPTNSTAWTGHSDQPATDSLSGQPTTDHQTDQPATDTNSLSMDITEHSVSTGTSDNHTSTVNTREVAAPSSTSAAATEGPEVTMLSHSYTSAKSTPTKPSERHPELLSRLTAGPKMSSLLKGPRVGMSGCWERGEVTERSRTPPPRLYPIQENMRGMYTEHSPPSLQPVSQHRPRSNTIQSMMPISNPRGGMVQSMMPVSQSRPRSNTIQSIMRRGSPEHPTSHLTAISSLKDKILKRIDSQENIRLSPQHAAQWETNQHQPPRAQLHELSHHDAPRRMHHDTSRHTQHSHPELQHSAPHNLSAQREHCMPQNGASDSALRKHAQPTYQNSPNPGSQSSSPNDAANHGGQQSMSQYQPPNGAMPMPLPPNSVGFFPGGRMPANMHPAMLLNSALQFQALQQLHVQAAQIQHQMGLISNMATINAIGPNPTATEPGQNKMSYNGSDRCDSRPMPTKTHSQHLANHRLDGEPMNLTKDPGCLRPMSNIKPEPL